MSEFSRRSRASYQGRYHRSKELKSLRRPSLKELRIKLPWLVICTFSALFSAFSVANPLLRSFADSLQSQSLYAGQAFAAGQVPYMDFYGVDGLLYYFVIFLGSFLGNTFVLVLLQFGVYIFSGIAFYKFIYHLTRVTAIAYQMTLAFYLCLGVLGWGGLYASLFALPFLLNGLLFLIKYLSDEIRDEGFIFYGLNGALTFLIDPKSSLLWLVSTVFLAVYHIRRHQKARGFYQFLAVLFGFLLVLYSVGYYTILYQNIGAAIEQTFLAPIQSLGQWQGDSLSSLLILAVYLLGTGLLTSLIYGAMSLSNADNRSSNLLLYINLICGLVVVCLTPYFSPSYLIVLIPYGLGLTGSYMANQSINSHHLVYDEDEQEIVGQPKIIKSYWTLNAFLPVLSLLYLFLNPAWIWMTQQELREERKEIATEIASVTTSDDRVYAWDNSALLYLDSERLASSRLITPDTYVVTSQQEEELNLALGYDIASYVLINKEQILTPSFAKHLEENYEQVDSDWTYFDLYKHK